MEKDSRILLPTECTNIITLLSNIGVPAYLVGGTIRDSLLSIPTNDIDLSVEGDALLIGQGLARKTKSNYIILDETRKICRLILTSTNKIQIDLTSITNGIINDLENRDFTINSMAININDVKTDQKHPYFLSSFLIDPNSGYKDLHDKTITPVCDNSLNDDPIRILRAIRLKSHLNFSLSNYCTEQITKKSHLITSSANERIREEFLKILSLDNASCNLKLMDKLGIMPFLIPKITELEKMDVGKTRNTSVIIDEGIQIVSEIEHIFDNIKTKNDSSFLTIKNQDIYFSEIIGNGHNRYTFSKLSCLLVGITKYLVENINSPETTHGNTLEHVLKNNVTDILNDFKLAKSSVCFIANQVANHLKPMQMSNEENRPSHKSIYEYNKKLPYTGIDILFLNMAYAISSKKHGVNQTSIHNHKVSIQYMLDELLRQKSLIKNGRLVTGHDIMSQLRLAPGPHIARLLDIVELARIEGKVTNKKESLKLIQNILESGE